MGGVDLGEYKKRCLGSLADLAKKVVANPGVKTLTEKLKIILKTESFSVEGRQGHERGSNTALVCVCVRG